MNLLRKEGIVMNYLTDLIVVIILRFHASALVIRLVEIARQINNRPVLSRHLAVIY